MSTVSDDPKYRLASITEFGAMSSEYEKVLGELEKRACHKREKHFDCQQTFVTAMGTADLVEILQFHHYLHLAEVGVSSAQAFRRSIGVLCPRREELGRKARDSEPVAIEILDRVLEPDPRLPFLTISYLKLSQPLALCMPIPGGGKKSLVRRLLAKISEPVSRTWTSYEKVLQENLGEEKAASIPRLKVAPLLGLDTVELVMVARAARLEQIAALAWSLRNQQVGDYWSAEPEYIDNLERILGEESGGSKLEELWSYAPVFVGTTTVVGRPVQRTDKRKGGSGGWELEPGNEGEVADRVFATIRSSYVAGSLDVIEETQQKFQLARKPQGEPGASEDQELPPGPGAFVMLFDRADVLHLPDSNAKYLGSIQMEDLNAHLDLMVGFEGNLGPGIYTSTDLALYISIPEDERADPKNRQALKCFRERLVKARELHLKRNREAPDAWTRRWLVATRELGVVYPLVNGTVNLISSVLDYLEDDLVGFAAVLPALSKLIGQAEQLGKLQSRHGRHHDDLTAIRWLARKVEALAASRGRRDHPLKAPKATLAFEGHAGYRASRDAFVVFVEALAEHLEDWRGKEGLVLVLDSAGGGASFEPSRERITGVRVVKVSAMILHHPLYWIFAHHELAHGLFAERFVRWKEKKGTISRHLEDLRRDLERIAERVWDEPLDSGEEVDLGASDSVAWNNLHDQKKNQAQWLTDFLNATIKHQEEVLADLLLFDTVAESWAEPTSDDYRRFWFVFGSMQLFDFQRRYGKVSSSHNWHQVWILGLMVRHFFVTFLLSDRDPGSWLSEFDRAVEHLEDMLELLCSPLEPLRATREYCEEHSRRYLRDEDAAFLDRCRCFGEDFRWTPDTWKRILGQLRGAVDILKNSDGHKAATSAKKEVVNWLLFAKETWIFLRKERTQRPKGHERQARLETLRKKYLAYLTGIQEGWGESAQPWLPYIDGHSVDKDDFSRRTYRFSKGGEAGAVASRRGGIFAAHEDGSHAGENSYHEKTAKLILELEDHARGLRYERLADFLKDLKPLEGSVPPKGDEH